jgi:glycosyltransferase involved in cell wall biosynthesis
MKIDLILCTHNPRWDYLLRTMDAIRGQESLPAGCELRCWLVDNNSSPEIAEKLKALCAERRFRYLHEKEQGQVHARMTGMRQTVGDLIVWSDDDTVFAPDYLAMAAKIAEEKQFLGIWGGSIVLELEKPVRDDIRPHLVLLTEHHVQHEEWSNYRGCPPVAGAGMCMRRAVVERCIKRYGDSPLYKYLGRSVENLFSGEDWDFCLTCAEMGLGVGRMPQLRLTHLIPERRTKGDYLLKIAYGHKFSAQIVFAVRGMALVEGGLRRKIFGLRLRQLLKPSFAKKVLLAELTGFEKGLRFVRENFPEYSPE